MPEPTFARATATAFSCAECGNTAGKATGWYCTLCRRWFCRGCASGHTFGLGVTARCIPAGPGKGVGEP